jgi:outer membrane receptor protein involved in Fe transport
MNMSNRMQSAGSGVIILLASVGAIAGAQARPDPPPPRSSGAAASDTGEVSRPATLLAPVRVAAEQARSAASSRTIRQFDLALRPYASSQALLMLAPGLTVAQHAGGGKAEQIFLRGFDADHGTDVAIHVDGVPVNMVSHAHGQGYADLHFLMPEVVEALDVRKGPYDASDGDLATAGAVEFRTKDRVSAPAAMARGGSFGTSHFALLLPLGGDVTRPGGYVAASAGRGDGAFDLSQRLRRANAFGKFTAPLGRATLIAQAGLYEARWDASGQVPERAVASGLIGRFGAIDSTEGGGTSRLDASLALRGHTSTGASWEARAWTVRYDFRLFSNFTLFREDPERGDGIEQRDARLLGGAHVTFAAPIELAARPGRLRGGAGTRLDDATVGLFRQAERMRYDSLVAADIRQGQFFAWAAHEIALMPRLRTELGVRADAFRFMVRDRRPAMDADSRLPGDARWKGIVSPKLNVAFEVDPATTLFANVGLGFHSNDARDVVSAPRDATVLPRAVGAEIGVRRTWHGASLGAALWNIDLGSELVYVGDEGVTEASGRTRRSGVDVDMRLRLAPWLFAQIDVALARGRFRDEPAGENRIPLAPTRAVMSSLIVHELGAFGGALSMRHVGDRPAQEDGAVVARGHTVWTITGRYRVAPRVLLTGSIDNMLDAVWNEAQFSTTSRLRGEPSPVTELHFTPGAPRSVTVGLEVRY